MSVMYVVIPLLPGRRADIESWMCSLDIACPEGNGRYPTLQELREVLDHLDGYTISYSMSRVFPAHWYADIVRADHKNGDWAFIVVNNYNGDETDTHEFYFERGAPRVMLPILQQLVPRCGPLILLPDTGAPPVVVTSQLDIDQATHELES